jgi:hypothetical protein
LNKSGRLLWVEAVTHAISHQGKHATLVIATDVTAQVKAAEPVPPPELELDRAQSVCHVGSWIWNGTSGTDHDYAWCLGNPGPRRSLWQSGELRRAIRLHPATLTRRKRAAQTVAAAYQ